MDDSQLVRTVRMLLRSYRTKYYALEERNIMRSVRGLRGGEEFRVESLGLEEGGQQGKPADAGGGEGGRGEREMRRVEGLGLEDEDFLLFLEVLTDVAVFWGEGLGVPCGGGIEGCGEEVGAVTDDVEVGLQVSLVTGIGQLGDAGEDVLDNAGTEAVQVCQFDG